MPTYDLTDGPQKRAYLAKITGPHPKYKLTREFLNAERQEGRHKFFRFTEPGIYEMVEYSNKGNQSKYYKQLDGESLSDLTEAEVIAHFNAPAEGQKPTPRRLHKCPECECWLPHHEITCALIDAPDSYWEVQA